jgi:hypothetical protein
MADSIVHYYAHTNNSPFTIKFIPALLASLGVPSSPLHLQQLGSSSQFVSQRASGKWLGVYNFIIKIECKTANSPTDINCTQSSSSI